MDKKWATFIELIKLGHSKKDAVVESDISMRYYAKHINEFPDIRNLIHKRWMDSRVKNFRSMSSKPGKENGRYIQVDEQTKNNILIATNKVMSGELDISRKELYSMFPPLQYQKVISIIKSFGIDINKLPHRGRNLFGDRNYWYGKEPPIGSGRGISGWVLLGGKSYFFRSLLECSCFITLHKQGIEFTLKPPTIKYLFEGRDRTYIPDLLIGKTIVEIKPHKLLDLELNLAKFEAARKWCLCNGFEFDVYTDKEYMDKKLVIGHFSKDKIWFLNNNHLQRYKNNYEKNSKRSNRISCSRKTC